MNLKLHEEDNFTDPEFDRIWNNQFLEAKKKLPDFDIREASLNPYSRLPSHYRSQRSRPMHPSYERGIVTSTVMDRNGEITVQTEDGSFESVELDELIWVEHFSERSPITIDLRSCMDTSRDSERFTLVRR